MSLKINLPATRKNAPVQKSLPLPTEIASLSPSEQVRLVAPLDTPADVQAVDLTPEEAAELLAPEATADRLLLGERRVRDAQVARVAEEILQGRYALTDKDGQPESAEQMATRVAQGTGGLAARLRRPSVAGGHPPHVVITARAGTGKTTTLVGALQVLKGQQPRDAKGRPMVPSDQQAVIWEAVGLSKGVRSVAFVAFNKSIANELQRRVPSGCDAMTMHSMGFKAVKAAFKLKPGLDGSNKYRVQNILEELLGVDIRQLRKAKPVVIQAVEELVGLCKMNLTEPGPDGWDEALGRLAVHYEVELDRHQREVFDLVPRVLDRCRDVARDGYVDFNDMIWLPVVLDLPMAKYDVLVVDEAQDLNRCQQALARKAGRRLIFCGDDRQAIYGFAGADSRSLPRMTDDLAATPEGCLTFPLTVTRRCGKAIVDEARKLVPDFEAHEGNGQGRVGEALYTLNADNQERPWEKTYAAQVREGDFILCRVNAPLVSQCFRFLKRGIKANIQGRDIGAGLVTTVKKLWKDGDTAVGFLNALEAWREGEEKKEQAKKNPSEARLIAVQDRYDCLACFAGATDSTREQVVARIEGIFTDNEHAPGVRLSSIHKAKGLEAHRVFLLQPKGGTVPHPMAKSAWQRESEYNLLYVAITRAVEELVYVNQ